MDPRVHADLIRRALAPHADGHVYIRAEQAALDPVGCTFGGEWGAQPGYRYPDGSTIALDGDRHGVLEAWARHYAQRGLLEPLHDARGTWSEV